MLLSLDCQKIREQHIIDVMPSVQEDCCFRGFVFVGYGKSNIPIYNDETIGCTFRLFHGFVKVYSVIH